MEEEAGEARRNVLATLEDGAVVRGTVRSLATYGAFESNLGVPPVSVSLLISGMSGQGLPGESPYNTARVTGSYWTVPSTLVPFAFSIDHWRPTTLRLGLGPPLDQGDSSIFDEI
jgi:hypothetical protein